jgi:two-component system invasion response regulator UvrY
MYRIIVVDDHALFRRSLKTAFKYECTDIHIVGEAEHGEELFAVLVSTPADLVLLDINLPDVGGADIARRLRSDYPHLKILAVSGDNTAETIRAMLDAGIDGFIGKQTGDTDELAKAIRSVMNGVEYFGRDVASIMYSVYVSKKKTTEVTQEFTDREREIILLCRKGLVVKEIADRLNVSINTIATHKKRIFQKLGINNQMEMVQYALKRGIIRIEP